MITDHIDSTYPAGFKQWLSENNHIFLAFKEKANEMRMVRNHYSARTIIEQLRWNSDLSDSGSLFKINNDAIPGMAKLYNSQTNTNFFNERKGVTK